MTNTHKSNHHTRLPAPIPGVPESQARALDRRRSLDRQLRSFGGPHRVERGVSTDQGKVSDPAGPGPA